MTCYCKNTCALYNPDSGICQNQKYGCLAYRTTTITHKEENIKKENKVQQHMDICTENKVQQHMDICEELNKLYERKNHDYGDSFHQSFLEEGMAMARIRLGDKLNRFKNLTRKADQEVPDESIRDTLVDLANYAIMTVMEMDKKPEEGGFKNE